MIRSFLTVSSGTLASRLLGFVRDSLVAALLGAGPVADAFLVAFQLVNVVRRLLTEDALNAALVPAYLRIHESEGAAAAAAFAGRLLATISAALIAATALIGLLMPLVVTALAPGVVGTDTLLLADGVATPLRITFDGKMRKFFANAIPGMIASSGPQLFMVAGAIIASSSTSAVSWLYFANRLVELTLGLVGVAMGTVLIPQMSRAV